VYGKEEVGVDDENEGSMDERNIVRYLRMNGIDITTECQVKSRIICY
jgi:ribulose bisphosphate carboxylase small subunit